MSRRWWHRAGEPDPCPVPLLQEASQLWQQAGGATPCAGATAGLAAVAAGRRSHTPCRCHSRTHSCGSRQGQLGLVQLLGLAAVAAGRRTTAPLEQHTSLLHCHSGSCRATQPACSLFPPPSYDMTVRLWDYAAPEDALVRVSRRHCCWPVVPPWSGAALCGGGLRCAPAHLAPRQPSAACAEHPSAPKHAPALKHPPASGITSGCT